MVLQKLRKVFEPIAMILILAGIIGLIQPIGIGVFRWDICSFLIFQSKL
jgi:hypothetical protein